MALYVIATPIGHLADLSPRAAQQLAAVDAILAEDTRNSRVLLDHIGVRTPLFAFHDHNEAERVPHWLAELQAGKDLALISDAGTPLVADPGYKLVRAAREAGVMVYALPGPCAAIAALSVAGLPSDQFLFAGFLPAKSAARRERLLELGRLNSTWVVYESSHRIAACLDDLAALWPDRRVCLARELTKKFEQSVWLLAQELPAWLEQDAHHQLGEFVLVVEGATETPRAAAIDADTLLRALLKELPAAKAAKLAAELTGEARATLYERASHLAASALGRTANR